MQRPLGERKLKRVDFVKWNAFRMMVAAAGSVMLVTLLGVYAYFCSYVYLAPSLPSAQAMRNVEMQVPLRIYTRSGALIAQIGEQRRIPVSYDQIPDLLKHAFLAAEDDRFFEHHGIDYLGVLRAVEERLPISTIKRLEKLGLERGEIDAAVIPARTLQHRRSRREKLTVEESDRVLRVMRVMADAGRVYGSHEAALA